MTMVYALKVSAESQVTSLIFFILQYNVDNVNARAVSKYHQRNHYRNKDINICTVAMRGMLQSNKNIYYIPHKTRVPLNARDVV